VFTANEKSTEEFAGTTRGVFAPVTVNPAVVVPMLSISHGAVPPDVVLFPEIEYVNSIDWLVLALNPVSVAPLRPQASSAE